MQAAFVDIGMEKAGFLYAGDFVTPRLGFETDESEEEDLVEDIDIHAARFPQEQFIPPIEGMIRESQHLIVQVAKEPLGTKGARITSHITLPGSRITSYNVCYTKLLRDFTFSSLTSSSLAVCRSASFVARGMQVLHHPDRRPALSRFDMDFRNNFV